MSEAQPLIPTIYAGWHEYQSKLIAALAPLTDVQLGFARRTEPPLDRGDRDAHDRRPRPLVSD